jgi:anti-sigma-K factor RskA
MSNELYVNDQLPAYALGSLDDGEAAQLAQHLVGCPACFDALAGYEMVVAKLVLAVPDASPPVRLKARVMRSIEAQSAGPVGEPRRSWWQQLASSFPRARSLWAVASLVLVVLLIGSNLWWWQRTNQDQPLVTSGGMQVIAMAGTEAAPSATGTLVIGSDGEYGTLVVDGLPALDLDHQYQLWLIRDGQRTSGGVFSVNPEGYGALLISSPQPLSSYPAFGITVEPEGGSSGPTGTKVMGTSS